MSDLRYAVGIDGGGTKTAVAVIDAEGVELGRGLGGPCNLATGSPEALRASVQKAVASALEAAGIPPGVPAAGVCAAVAGYSCKSAREPFAAMLAELMPTDTVRLAPDYVASYWGALAGEPGVVVCAGTGAVAYGRSAAGLTCRVGGEGYVLGDTGSAFDIGRGALSHVMTTYDDGRAQTRFGKRLLAEIGARDREELTEWLYRDFQPARVAALAMRVGEWAAEGDRWATALLAEAASHLRAKADRVAARLALDPRGVQVRLLGSVWAIHPLLPAAFLLGRWPTPADTELPDMERLKPAHDAAIGAALLALRPEVQW